MPNIIQILHNKGLIKPPGFVLDVQYLTIGGSQAYGTNRPDSDFDLLGFCIPPKETMFPHLGGEIPGFGRQPQRFKEWGLDKVRDPDACGGTGRQYDLKIYSIVQFFQLCMENNPNVLDLLFTPTECVEHATRVGNLVRDKRRLFLHKGCWHKFKGYAFSQLQKMCAKNLLGSDRCLQGIGSGARLDEGGAERKPIVGSKRHALREQYGFDVKHAVHTLRLLYECEQILETGDLDLRRNQDELKAVLRGDVGEEEIREKFAAKEKHLERLYGETSLRWGPDVQAIRELLLSCLEEHFGNMSACVVRQDAAAIALKQIQTIAEQALATVA